MNTFLKKRISGFTVIELMIVVVLISILMLLAYPSYTKYARKATRGEAQQLLMNWAVNLEIWRSNNPTYAGAGLDPSHDKYNFAIDADAAGYALTATPQGDQAQDVARDNVTVVCTLTLNQNGTKLPAGCWE